MAIPSTSLSSIGIEDGLFLGRSCTSFGGTIKQCPGDFIVRASTYWDRNGFEHV